MAVRQAELMTALYDYAGQDQPQGLSLAAGCIVVVLERLDTGWCRGEFNNRQGWFPSTYVQPAQTHGWVAFMTEEGRVYYQSPIGESFWTIPEGGFQPMAIDAQEAMLNRRESSSALRKSTSSISAKGGGNASGRKANTAISCLTYPETEAEIAEQQSLAGSSFSYVDHFWSDKGEQSGLDVMVGKNTRGKTAIKEMADFMRERATIEDQYAKALAKLARTQYGDGEEGSLRDAWKEVRSGVQSDSATHASFATKLLNDLERPMMTYLESNKKSTKKHEQRITEDRKVVRKEYEQVERSRMAYDKVDARKDRRRYQQAVEDLKGQIDRYNTSQYKWVEDMIAVAGDMEQYEADRHKFVKNMIMEYVHLLLGLSQEQEQVCVAQESALDKVHTNEDKTNWVVQNETGRVRPVDMK